MYVGSFGRGLVEVEEATRNTDALLVSCADFLASDTFTLSFALGRKLTALALAF
jgi:hypothetical protein